MCVQSLQTVQTEVRGHFAFVICIAAGEHTIVLFLYPLHLIWNCAETSYFNYYSSHLVC